MTTATVMRWGGYILPIVKKRLTYVPEVDRQHGVTPTRPRPHWKSIYTS